MCARNQCQVLRFNNAHACMIVSTVIAFLALHLPIFSITADSYSNIPITTPRSLTYYTQTRVLNISQHITRPMLQILNIQPSTLVTTVYVNADLQ